MDFTIQYLFEEDWNRVTAIYSNLESVLHHANDLLKQGKAVRLLVRYSTSPSKHWYKLDEDSNGSVTLGNRVWDCPQ